MQKVVENIRVADIDFTDKRFSCSCPLESKSLTASIERVGLLRPLTLVRLGEVFCIASGLRRALAVRQLGHENVMGIVLSDPVPDGKILFRTNLEDNLATREFNFFEKALAIKRLIKDFQLPVESSDFKQCLQVLSLSSDARTLNRCLAIAELDEGIKSFILDRGWSDKYADPFLSLEPGDAFALLDMAKRWRLTAGYVRELCESASEVAERDDLGFHSVLQKLESTPHPEGANTGQVREAFIRHLREMRFSAFSAANTEMEKSLASINAEKGVAIQPPPYLEGDTFTATMTFKTPQELAARAKALIKFGGSDSCAKAIALLG